MSEPTLKRLAQRLERVGMVTAPYGDHVAVRLPLLCRVHVSVRGGRLHCEAFTGTVTRTRATLLIFAMLGVLLATTFTRHGITSDALTLGFLTVLAVAWETIRYVLTEACITRVQATVLAEPGLLDEEPALASLPAGGRAALGSGAGAVTGIRLPSGERVRDGR